MALATPSWLPPAGTHEITIGSTVRRSLANARPTLPPSRASQNDFLAMRFNFKPPAVANAGGVFSPVNTGPGSGNESYSVELASETGEQHSFSAKPLPQQTKSVECVLFYDPKTGKLVIERLDALLTVTHERHAPSNGLPNGHARPLVAPISATTLPPTPPSTSPPGYVNLPAHRSAATSQPQPQPPQRAAQPSTRTRYDAGTPHARAAVLPERVAEPEPAENIPSSVQSPFSQPQSLSDYAASQRLREQQQQAKARAASSFATDPDEEEILTFGQPARPSPRTNVLGLHTRKRSFSDSEPDEEELQFGQPARPIKRAKSSHSPPDMIVSNPTPPASATLGLALPPVLPPQQPVVSYAQPSWDIPGPETQDGMESDDDASDADDDLSDSDDDVQPGIQYYPPTHTHVHHEVEADGDDDDFLAAAMDDGGGQTGANNSDDSSDESDYDER